MPGLRPLAGIVFEPIALGYSFRWGGEFGPQARGPQAYAQSGPVPLPSTVAGALAGTALAAMKQPLCRTHDLYDDVRRGLRLLLCPGGGDFALRGPYLYARKEDQQLLCAPLGRGQGLFCVAMLDNGRLRVCTPSITGVQAVGIALNNLSKTVIEGLIYTSVYIDPVEVLRSASRACGLDLSPTAADTAGIIIEAYVDESCATNFNTVKQLLNGAIAQLGGETRPTRIRVTHDRPGLKLAEMLDGRSRYLYVASPLLLPGRIKGKYSRPPGDQRARQIVEEVLKALGLEPGSKPVAWGRLRLTAVGLGYSLCRNKRRPYHAAILPGAVLDATADKRLTEAYMRGFGRHRELGWGTLLPIPDVPRQERKKCHA